LIDVLIGIIGAGGVAIIVLMVVNIIYRNRC
jgi:hypothetical protein